MLEVLTRESAGFPHLALATRNSLSGRILWWLLAIIALPMIVLLGYWAYYRVTVGAIVENPKLALRVERWSPRETSTNLQIIDLGYGAIQLPSRQAYRTFRSSSEIHAVILDCDDPRLQIVFLAPFFDEESELKDLRKSFEALGEGSPPSSSFALQFRLLDPSPVSFWDVFGLGPKRFILNLAQAMFKSLTVSGAKRFSRFDREHYSFLITELANGSVHVSVFDHTTKLQQGIWVGNDNELTRQALNTIMLTYTIKPDATSSDAVTKLISGLPLRQTDHQVDEKTKVDAGGN